MTQTAPAEESSERAADICRHFDLGGDAKRLLRGDPTPEAFVRQLLEHRLYADGIWFMAHNLPPRAAVWWGCLCTWKVCRPKPPEKEAAALQAAVRWVEDPTDESRRAAGTAGKAAGAETPAGAVALAGFYSTGSLAPPNLPEFAPPPFLAAKTIAAAVRACAARAEPEKQAGEQRLFVELGQDVAAGKNRWHYEREDKTLAIPPAAKGWA